MRTARFQNIEDQNILILPVASAGVNLDPVPWGKKVVTSA
jgi:hypothetical protein